MVHDFKLSAELAGHENDVRQVAALPENGFVSVSRDCTAKIWQLCDNNKWENVKTLTEHQQTADRGGIAAVHVLPRHHPTWQKDTMVTGGYDKTIIVWQLPECAVQQYLLGHQGAVLCIHHLDSGELISGSSDSSIIVWKGANVFKMLQGHEHPVWSVLGLPNLDIVSGSGDQTIKIWRQYQCIQTIKAHKASVRHLCLIPDIGFSSASNDGMVKTWSSDGELLDKLEAHEDSVYAVAMLPNGEGIASVSEDGTLRVWHENVCGQQLNAPAGIWSVAVLENGDLVSGCQDRMIRIWTCEEVRALPESERIVYEEEVQRRKMKASEGGESQAKPKIGQVEYDHVFDVETEEGQKFKLGYNNRDDPAVVAQNFVQEHQLLPSMLDQVIEFIEKATNRSAERDSMNSTWQLEQSVHFPASCPILVGNGNFERIRSKIEQFNEELKSSSDNRSASAPEEEMMRIHAMIDLLRDTRRYHVSQVEQEDVDLIFNVVNRWPRERKFPILDLIRLGMIHSEFAKKSIQHLEKVVAELAVESPHANQIMALRCISNTFKTVRLHEIMAQMAEPILQTIEPFLASENESINSLASALLVNYSIALTPLHSEAKAIVLRLAIQKVLMRPDAPNKSVYHSVVALGTLLATADASFKQLATQPRLIEQIRARLQSSEQATHSALLDLYSVLTASPQLPH